MSDKMSILETFNGRMNKIICEFKFEKLLILDACGVDYVSCTQSFYSIADYLPGYISSLISSTAFNVNIDSVTEIKPLG